MNIIVIVADDLGWHDVGYHGSEINTPFIDELALNGVQLQNFYAQTVCSPTRAALMTGTFPYKYGLQRVIWGWNNHGLDLNYKILPQYLKELNYKTYIIGKWHLGHAIKEYLPTFRGFDYHYGPYTGAISYWDHTNIVHDFHENAKPIYPKGHATDLFCSKAIELIKQSNDKFFMYLAFNAPHLPLDAYPYWCDRNNITDQNRHKYGGLVSHLDFAIGKIVAALREKGIYDDTLIWFTSDNGGWLGIGGSNNYPLRDGKLSTYEGGVKVVSFINYKPINNLKVFNGVCHVVDVLPTLLGFTNTKVNNIDGKNMFNDDLNNRTLIHSFAKNNGFVGCIRDGDWKLHKYNNIELYNIKEDPGETNNLAPLHPEIVSQLLTKLENCGDKYVVDIENYRNGPPPGFRYPNYWGPQKMDSSFSMKELFGYS